MSPQTTAESIARQVETARERLENIFQRAQGTPEGRALLDEAMQELSTALEELRVTAETLKTQNDELAATRSLVEAQRRNYQELFDLAPDAYLVTDPAGVVQQANHKAAALLGVREDFLAGKPILVFIPQHQRRDYGEMLARLDLAPYWEFELELQPRQGEPFPAAVTVSIVRQNLASGRQVIGLRWLIRDVTKQKRADAQIRSQVNRLTALGAINEAITSTLDLDTILDFLLAKIDDFFPYPIVVTVRLFDPETRTLEPRFCRNINAAEWHDSASRTMGARATEAIRSHAPLVIPDVQSDARTSRPEFYRKHRLVSAITTPLIVKDEALGVLSVYTRESREFAAEEVDFLSTIGNQAAIAIQNSRLYEQGKKQTLAVQKAHDELEDKVAERTAELEKANAMLRAEVAERRKIEERLRASETQLSRLTEQQEQQLIASDRLVSLGELSASIAHEFNNPLQIIMGFAQELLDDEAPGPRYDGLKIIEAETVRCRELIRNLMNFARPVSGKPEATEIEPIVANAVKLAWQFLLKSKVQLATAIAPGLPPIHADPNQLQQVMINLLFNAAEAMPQGGEVKISAALTPDKTRAVISVSDTGVGISADALPNIFRPFFTTKPKKGMGLGLSICERIVRAHGGRIDVESAEGHGATFHLYFPIAEENTYERAS